MSSHTPLSSSDGLVSYMVSCELTLDLTDARDMATLGTGSWKFRVTVLPGLSQTYAEHRIQDFAVTSEPTQAVNAGEYII